MTTYVQIAAALSRAKERSGATDVDDGYLTELLNMSAGVDADGVTHFRPFYCAARWLEQELAADNRFTRTGDVSWTGRIQPISSLMALQMDYDQANGLTIPTGFDAEPAGKAAPLPRFTSVSVSTTPTI
ncbi:MAG: hypothetical protein ACFB0G_11130 [Leptolyngbyaceae cyanobacterium]